MRRAPSSRIAAARELSRENVRRPRSWPSIRIEAKPQGMAITTHMCRGNFRSSWVASDRHLRPLELTPGNRPHIGNATWGSTFSAVGFLGSSVSGRFTASATSLR